MNIVSDSPIKFDCILPIYNWYYPLAHRGKVKPDEVFSKLDTTRVKTRALYFHIPFCESICWFCPFARSKLQDQETLEAYMGALILEIELKARDPTPSLSWGRRKAESGLG